MTDEEKLCQCRMAEQKRLYNLMLEQNPKKTETARRIITTELLKEERYWRDIQERKKQCKD